MKDWSGFHILPLVKALGSLNGDRDEPYKSSKRYLSHPLPHTH